MLRASLGRLAVSAYSLFMIEQKANPALQGMKLTRRGRFTARLYRGLSPKDRAALERRANAHPAFKSRPKVKLPRRKSAYQRFMAKNYHSPALRKLTSTEKFQKIAEMWSERQSGKAPTISPTKARGSARQSAKKAVVAAVAASKKTRAPAKSQRKRTPKKPKAVHVARTQRKRTTLSQKKSKKSNK